MRFERLLTNPWILRPIGAATLLLGLGFILALPMMLWEAVSTGELAVKRSTIVMETDPAGFVGLLSILSLGGLFVTGLFVFMGLALTFGRGPTTYRWQPRTLGIRRRRPPPERWTRRGGLR